MSHSVYLIDYENTALYGLYGIGSINPNDEIIIFYSSNPVSIEVVRDMLKVYERNGFKIKYFNLENKGKNALDFMITAYMGYSASKNNIGKIAVISKDKGYVSVIPVITEINSSVKLVFEECIYNVLFPEQKTSVKPADTKNNTIQKTDFDSMTNIQKKQFITELIQKEKKIADSYIQVVTSLILKYIDDKESFTKNISKQLGKKSENQKYKKEAEKYFDRIKKLII